MPRRILTIKEMQKARKAVRFCYLCGKSLEGAPAKDVSVEHVLARGALDAKPTNDSWWPVTLRVHRKCEEEMKSQADADTIAMQRVSTLPPESVSKSDRGRIRKLLQKGREVLPASVSAVPGWSAVRSSRHTVRGFHAALYSGFVPAQHPSLTLAPVPGFVLEGPGTIGEQLVERAELTEGMFVALESARLNDEWDGITAWGGNLRYRCIWIKQRPPLKGVSCTWTLDTPESRRWSKSVSGEEQSWRGGYWMPAAPPNATMLTDQALDKLADKMAAVTEQLQIRFMHGLAGRVPPWR